MRHLYQTLLLLLQYIPAGAGVSLPDVASATRLLDIRASAAEIAALADGDPVGTITNRAPIGGSFTQSGSARPTKQTDGGGHPYVLFDGVDDALIAGAAINAALDNLDSFAVFMAVRVPVESATTTVINKLGVDNYWDAHLNEFYWGNVTDNEGDGRYHTTGVVEPAFNDNTWRVMTLVRGSASAGAIYANGVDAGASDTNSGGAPSSTANSDPVRIGVSDSYALAFTLCDLAAIRIYAPAPNAPDSALIVADMAADTGVTL